MNQLYSRVAVGAFLILTMAAVPPANAASCTADNCTNATIKALLVDWGGNIQVRFNNLTGLSCNYSAPYNQVSLLAADPFVKEKYSLILAAYMAAKPLWFYATNHTDGHCKFTMVGITQP